MRKGVDFNLRNRVDCFGLAENQAAPIFSNHTMFFVAAQLFPLKVHGLGVF